MPKSPAFYTDLTLQNRETVPDTLKFSPPFCSLLLVPLRRRLARREVDNDRGPLGRSRLEHCSLIFHPSHFTLQTSALASLPRSCRLTSCHRLLLGADRPWIGDAYGVLARSGARGCWQSPTSSDGRGQSIASFVSFSSVGFRLKTENRV